MYSRIDRKMKFLVGEVGSMVQLSRHGVSVRRLIVTAKVVPSSPIRVTLMMEELRSSETSVLTRATRRNILEDGILYKDVVHTSEETYDVSVTEPSHLMLCKIWGFHGADYEECRLLGCYVVWLL
jgi:hypothetical protein